MKLFILVLMLVSVAFLGNIAQAQSRTTVIYVHQPACGGCVHFQQSVLSSSAVQQELRNYNFSSQDIRSVRYRVNFTPAIIVIKNGNVRIFVPAFSPQSFINQLRSFK